MGTPDECEGEKKGEGHVWETADRSGKTEEGDFPFLTSNAIPARQALRYEPLIGESHRLL
jgi:hypothetical protein